MIYGVTYIAFTISMVEYEATIPTLWEHVRGISSTVSLKNRLLSGFFVDFTRENPQYVAKNNYMGFISDNAGKKYNLCHCTSTFNVSRQKVLKSW